MKRLEGKVAVVTGGNSGIGLATAKRLQEEGARVAISGRNKRTLEEAVQTIGNGVVAVVQADVAKPAELEKLYAEIKQKLGRIDVLFVNAGVAKFAPLADTPESLFDEAFDINVKGAYFTIQKALPLLNDGASIVLNTSVADQKGNPGASAYSATKAALRSLARTAAAELVGRGIRVNAVAPGPIKTPIFGKTGLPKEQIEEFEKELTARVPMKRVGKADRGFPGFAGRIVHHRNRNKRGWRLGTDLIVRDGVAAKAVNAGPTDPFMGALPQIRLKRRLKAVMEV
jgi:NAD(P)-dependent dehydrogenase (short-subunit alcohol dehydrogenase family)